MARPTASTSAAYTTALGRPAPAPRATAYPTSEMNPAST